MILGQVRQRFPRVNLSIESLGQPIEIEFVLDTGFEGDLTIPPRLISQLEAPLVSYENLLMADGSRRRIASYEVTILWDGEHRVVEALALEGRPLVGTDLLDGCLLQMEMTEGGEVSIEVL